MTLSAEKAEPSWNLTPWRRSKRHFLPSAGSWVQAVARPGMISAGRSARERSQFTSGSKTGKPRKRMPSEPLFGMPVVVGTSEAVIATRRTLGAWAWAVSGTIRLAARARRLKVVPVRRRKARLPG